MFRKLGRSIRSSSARRIAACALAAAACSAAIPTADAATSLGQTGSSTVACDGPASYVQSATGAPPVYAIPAGGGVITAWSTKAGLGGAKVKLAVMRATETPNQFTTVRTSAAETLARSSMNSFATSLPAQAGDVLGMLIISGAHNCVLINTASDDDRGFREVGSIFGAGETGTYTEASQSARRLNLAARLESDENADGFGDEAPKTKITRRPGGKIHGHQVSFRFKSDDPVAKFECKLDARSFKPCRSPLKVKTDAGRHRFAVRAIDADEHRDRSPAADHFRVGN